MENLLNLSSDVGFKIFFTILILGKLQSQERL